VKLMQTRGAKRSMDNVLFEWLVNLLLIFVLIAVLVPLWYVIIVSLTPLKVNQLQGSNLFLPPTEWSLEAYKQLLIQDSFLRALINSCILTFSGVALNVILTTLTAYALTFKDLPGRNIFLTLILFTFLFNPGLVPTYLLVKDLGLLNTYAAIILPGAISVYNLLVMKTFFQNLPASLREAAILEWLSTGEGYYLAGFGQKGVNYNLDSKGDITLQGVPTPFTDQSMIPYIQLHNLVYNGNPAELAVRYHSFTTKAGRTEDPIQVYNTFASMPWQDTTSTFVIPPASNQVDINTYVNENLVQFVTGQKPLDPGTWNTFIQGLNGLGVSDWEAAAQKALQEKGLLPT
jgi:hypothetical protein